MENSIYATLSRQSGLMREMQVIANNIANSETTGFRREGVVFSEYLAPGETGRETLAMAHAKGRILDLEQAGIRQTGGTFDLALEGDGFFAVRTPAGLAITRAGAFIPGPEGELLTADGYQVLDEGLSPVQVPPGAATISIAPDGTMSADGQLIGRIGVFAAPPKESMTRQSGTLFAADENLEPLEYPRLRQGFLEESNVSPIKEISRMIEVQRAYEIGQKLLDREDRRIRDTITALTR